MRYHHFRHVVASSTVTATVPHPSSLPQSPIQRELAHNWVMIDVQHINTRLQTEDQCDCGYGLASFCRGNVLQTNRENVQGTDLTRRIKTFQFSKNENRDILNSVNTRFSREIMKPYPQSQRTHYPLRICRLKEYGAEKQFDK